VQALHRAGIRVILDVVYNHTFNLDESNFEKTYPGYFYRYKADGTPSNGSGCGNETASDKPMMRAFMAESMKYWMDEYHIDGFRVDLMGVHDIETMNTLRRELSAYAAGEGGTPSPYAPFIYGEGWAAGTCAYPADKLAMKANMQQMPGIAAFSDEMRDALRGPFSDDTEGAFLIGKPGHEESIKFGIAGAIDHPQIDYAEVNYAKQPWATEPTQMMAYVSCHDDMCLYDRLKAEQPEAADSELIRQDLLAQTAVLTSQGVPFMLAGEEVLRTKYGVHNSFKSPDHINQIDWTAMQAHPEVYSYYKRLIQLRKGHPAFRLGSATKVREHLEFLPTQPCLVGFVLKNHAGGDAWPDIYVVLNGGKQAAEVSVPEGRYTIVAMDGVIDEQGIETVDGGKVTVGPQSALIMHD